MRGTPSEGVAAWLQKGTLRLEGKKPSQQDVFSLMKSITSLLLVDGRCILDTYKTMVLDSTEVTLSSSSATASSGLMGIHCDFSRMQATTDALSLAPTSTTDALSASASSSTNALSAPGFISSNSAPNS
jgi:hypothetical protein